jgi:hypothetical protein
VRVGQVLANLGNVVALHDRHTPRSRYNIDHIAVTPAGVWVIDAKVYQDQHIDYRETGGLFRVNPKLYVSGRDKTNLVEATTWQVETVARAAAGLLGDTSVRALVCFVGATWGWRRKPFMVREAAICWPSALPEILGRPGPFDAAARQHLAAVIAEALPPAVG